MTRLRHVMKVSLLVICNNGVAKGLGERFKFAVGDADSAENVCVPPQMVNSNGTGVITSLQLVIISVRHNWVNHSSCMRPELCVCPQNFVYASRFSNIVKRVVKSLVYRQQQFRLWVTFNSAVRFVTSVKNLVNSFVYESRSTMQCQQANSSRRQEYRQKLRLGVNFQITASTRAGVDQCSIAFATVVRAINVVRMAR